MSSSNSGSPRSSPSTAATSPTPSLPEFSSRAPPISASCGPSRNAAAKVPNLSFLQLSLSPETIACITAATNLSPAESPNSTSSPPKNEQEESAENRAASPDRAPATRPAPPRAARHVYNRTICWFWYHSGACRRGKSSGYRCFFRHCVAPGLRLEAPPGFVHREVCWLPLCPLRGRGTGWDERVHGGGVESVGGGRKSRDGGLRGGGMGCGGEPARDRKERMDMYPVETAAGLPYDEPPGSPSVASCLDADVATSAVSRGSLGIVPASVGPRNTLRKPSRWAKYKARQTRSEEERLRLGVDKGAWKAMRMQRHLGQYGQGRKMKAKRLDEERVRKQRLEEMRREQGRAWREDHARRWTQAHPDRKSHHEGDNDRQRNAHRRQHHQDPQRPLLSRTLCLSPTHTSRYLPDEDGGEWHLDGFPDAVADAVNTYTVDDLRDGLADVSGGLKKTGQWAFLFERGSEGEVLMQEL